VNLEWQFKVPVTYSFFLGAIYAASQRGHQRIIRLLLDYRADIKTQVGIYGNYLYTALQGGYKEIVKILQQRRIITYFPKQYSYRISIHPVKTFCLMDSESSDEDQ